MLLMCQSRLQKILHPLLQLAILNPFITDSLFIRHTRLKDDIYPSCSLDRLSDVFVYLTSKVVGQTNTTSTLFLQFPPLSYSTLLLGPPSLTTAAGLMRAATSGSCDPSPKFEHMLLALYWPGHAGPDQSWFLAGMAITLLARYAIIGDDTVSYRG